jgi:hypothetical protein
MNQFPVDTCRDLERVLGSVSPVIQDHTNQLLDDHWLYISCAFLNDIRTRIEITLASIDNDDSHVLVDIDIKDLLHDDPIDERRGPLDLVLEMLGTFTRQVDREQLKESRVQLPLRWNPLT